MGLANPRCWGYNSKQNNMSPAGLMGERGDKERNNKQLQCQVVKENEGVYKVAELGTSSCWGND